MAKYGHPLFMDQLCNLTSKGESETSFIDDIHGPGWMHWFKKRHFSLALRQSQGLEVTRAKGLSAENIDTFYRNLEDSYRRHYYPLDHMWNCNESNSQASQNGGG